MKKQAQLISTSFPRRTILQGGLAGLAAAMLKTNLVGCSSEMMSGTISMDASGVLRDANQLASDRGFPSDAKTMDAGSHPDAQQLRDAQAEADAGQNETDAAGGPDAGPMADFPSRMLPAEPMLASLIANIGPLQDADSNGVRLPVGFSSRIVARSVRTVSGTNYRWHRAPDGGATYSTEDGGWIYVSNAEISSSGGVGAIRFDSNGQITDAYPILERTSRNCAGGKTPWHTWLSCEETSRGQVYECSPWGDREPILRAALGSFKHEAVAVDPATGYLYLTEDERDGCFYRFVPARNNALGFPDLGSGTLEVATVSMTGRVTWSMIPDPEYMGSTPTRDQVPGSTSFNGGEGIWYHGSAVYFSTKGDNKVWAYDIRNSQLRTIYDGNGILDGVDNVTVSCCGDVLVAEDGGSMEIVAILPSGELKPLIEIEGQDRSEITGPAFDPSGTRLYFSSQRGTTGSSYGGITYEVTGPFHQVI